LLSAQPPAKKPPPPGGAGAVRPILKTGELMAQFNGPRYKQLKKALAAPNADPKAIHMTALEVAEIANLIAIRRPAGGEGRDWEQGAVGLQEAALRLADAAKGGQDVGAAAGGLIQACNKCHQRFAPDEAPILK
jgi:alpha-D-ribose 1-methylphosphonate 5-triphosphate synthase subunit PhnG